MSDTDVSSNGSRRAGPTPEPPGSAVALLRGLGKRCPRCGRRGLFRRWFRLAARCPSCGLELERGEGAFLGSMAINYGITAAAFVVLLVVWLILDLPDVNVLALTLASAAVVVAMPLLAYPFAKTLWASLDYLAHRSELDREQPRAGERSELRPEGP